MLGGVKIKIDDIIFCLRGSVGKLSINKTISEGTVASSLVAIRAKDVNPDYLYYYLQSPIVKMQTDIFMNGTCAANLSAENVGNYYFIEPPQEEQEKIASYLDQKCSAIDNIIAKQEQIIEGFKAYKIALITEAVTKGLDPSVEMKDSKEPWIGNVPKNWDMMSLGALSDDIRNGYVGPTRDIFVESGIPYIQSLHVKDGKISFDKAEYYVTPEWGLKHPKVQEGQIVIVQTGDIGQVGLVEESMSGYNCHALIIVTLNKKLIVPKYLQYYLRSKPGKELLLQTSTGALLPHLNSGKVKSTTITCPPIEEQKSISDYLDKKCNVIDKSIDLNLSTIQRLIDYKKALIYEVVTGKKEV